MSLGAREDVAEVYESMQDAAPASIDSKETIAPIEPAPVVEAGSTPPPPTETTVRPAGKDGRDPKGRFASKNGTAAPATGEPTTTAPPAKEALSVTEAPKQAVPSSTPVPETMKAPQSWKPELREKFGSLPPEIQAEVTRRERESTLAIEQGAGLRKFANAFQQTLQPYGQMLQASGGDPFKMMGGILGMAHQIQNGAPQDKARTLAQLIHQSGTSVEALAAELDRQPGQPQARAQPPPADPRVDQLFSYLQQQEQRRAQATAQKVSQEAEAFAGGKEFFEDVRDDVADLLETAAKRGVALSLDEAYDRACWANKGIRTTVQQREAAKAANASQASTQQGKAAASSVKSQPASGPASSNRSRSTADDMRAALAASRNR